MTDPASASPNSLVEGGLTSKFQGSRGCPSDSAVTPLPSFTVLLTFWLLTLVR